MIDTIADLILPGAQVAPALRVVEDRPVEVVESARGLERRRVLEQRLRNDEVLLTRQAREIAALEGVIGRLEQELDRTANDLGDLRARPLVQPAVAPVESTPLTAEEEAPVTYELVRETVVVQPTVYTNLGSLLDVFA